MPSGIPSAKDMKELKVRLRAKKEEWDQEEVQRARGQVRFSPFRDSSLLPFTLT